MALLATMLTLGTASAGAAYVSTQDRPVVNHPSALDNAPGTGYRHRAGGDRRDGGDDRQLGHEGSEGSGGSEGTETEGS